jgi:hypothetical protein
VVAPDVGRPQPFVIMTVVYAVDHEEPRACMNDTTLLPGLPGVVVDRVEVDPGGARVVHVRTRDTPRGAA